MFRLLSQPYPTEESARRILVRAAAIASFVGLFLLVFQPFGLDDWETPAKTEKILGFGLVTLFVMTANSFLLPTVFPRFFSDDRWTVGREIARVLLLLLVIAVGNRLYLGWLFNESPTPDGWLQMIGITFLIGIFPTVGAVVASYIIRLRRYSRTAAELPDNPVPPLQKEPSLRERVSAVWADKAPDSVLLLVADNEKDTLRFRSDALLFIESSDNYCTVAYLKGNLTGSDQIVKHLFRSSLSRLETQIADKPDSETTLADYHAYIVRCHRSYIVNLSRVERVTGNAQGYKLHLLGGEFQVPVARRYNDSLIRQLKSLT